jgi:hypothetical protein
MLLVSIAAIQDVWKPDDVRLVCAVGTFAMNAWVSNPCSRCGSGVAGIRRQAVHARDIPGPAMVDNSELQKPPLTVERDRGRAAVSGCRH